MDEKSSLKPMCLWWITLILSFSLLFVVRSIGQETDQVKEQIFKEAREVFQRAQEEGVPLLSPNNFAKAEEFYQRALRDYEKGESLKRIRENIERAMEHMEAAFESAKLSRVALEYLIQMRDETIALEVSKYAADEFTEAERKFRQAAMKVEDGDMNSARTIAQDAEKAYRRSALIMFQRAVLTDIREYIERTKDTMTGQNYNMLSIRLRNIEGFLERQQKVEFDISEFTEQIRERIYQALIEAQVGKEFFVLDIFDVRFTQKKAEAQEITDALRGILLEATDEVTKRDAIDSLQQISPDMSIPVLQEVIRKDTNPYIRERAIFALAQTRRYEILPFLQEIALKDTSASVRSAALTNMHLLKQLHPPAKKGKIELQVKGKIKKGNIVTLIAKVKSSADGVARVGITKLPEQVQLESKTIQWKGRLRANRTKRVEFKLLLLEEGKFYIPVELILEFGNKLDFEETKGRVYFIIDEKGGRIITPESDEFPQDKQILINIIEGGE